MQPYDPDKIIPGQPDQYWKASPTTTEQFLRAARRVYDFFNPGMDVTGLATPIGTVAGPVKAARKLLWKPEDVPSRHPQWLTSKVKDLYEKVYKIKEEVPVIRRQKEEIDFPVSAGSRGGVFVSPYKEYHDYGGSGGGEGGEFRVDTKYTAKNPLIIPRIGGLVSLVSGL